MVRKLIEWAVDNPLIVLLFAAILMCVGGYSFYAVNVEAYPDPAPAIIEVVAQSPGWSAEEMERQVTIPLEITLAGMPGLTTTRTKSLFGLSHLRNQFDYGIDFERAKQEVINRLSLVSLPNGIQPQISPQSPTGEIYRYTLSNPTDALGRPIYTLNDIKALQDYVVQRELVRVPRIAGVSSSGGTTKRYEIHPDPDRLRQYGITLAQVQNAIASSNANVGGDYLPRGQTVQVVRGIGLIGAGQDPATQVIGMGDPVAAAAVLRIGEAKRLREIRQIVLATVGGIPVRVDQVVEGGPMLNPDGTPKFNDRELGLRGVVVGYQTRLGRVSLSRPMLDAAGHDLLDANGKLAWEDYPERIQGIVLLRKGYESLPALHDVKAKVDELNQPGHLLPGVQIETYYNRTDLINVTTETVQENLLVGMSLVAVILLMFLSNVRVALIVAINIPLALLFAFSMLYVRGHSANLLSIGAVDFGIIVDSTVIMVEAIYRHLSSGEHADWPLKQRIVRACSEIERSLFFSTVIMVSALLPLFAMKGPEGQIFRPMADTYAFALGGALLLAMTVSPVLCLLFLKRLPPARDNLIVRTLKWLYLAQLWYFLRFRWLTLAVVLAIFAGTAVAGLGLGREFMPELEEGNFWIRGTFPIAASFDEVGVRVDEIRAELREKFPEVSAVVPQIGRPDDGTDPTSFYNVEIFVPLRPFKDWPIPKGWDRPRTKRELESEMNADLRRRCPGVDWNFSQNIRDNVMEALSGVKGDNSVKIIGPELNRLEELGEQVRSILEKVEGVENAGLFRTQGQANLEFPIDRQKCAFWGVNPTDALNTLKTAVGGQAFTQMIEGEKTFDVTLRFPWVLRNSEPQILNTPVEVGNTVPNSLAPSLAPTPFSSGSTGPDPRGTSRDLVSPSGSAVNAPQLPTQIPRRRLRDLVTPIDAQGRASESGQFLRPGASTIYREQGKRMIAIKFSVRNRDLASTVDEAKAKVLPLIELPYRTEWSGEFQEMEEAEARLIQFVAISMVLITVLLYLAFKSVLDVLTVLFNVLAVSTGGIWALILTGTNFNISAGVGFISILGVAIMNGLILVSSFNGLRSQGVPLEQAILIGYEKRIRPLLMTLLTAILGLLPAAFSTRIGAQSQRPLAIVVVGGMVATLLLTNLVPVLYSFYGRRTPPASGNLAH